MRTFVQRLGIIPFESVIGALVLFTGLIDLTHIGTVAQTSLDALLPAHTVVVLDIMYSLAGAAMLWGIGRGKAQPEAFGIALLLTEIVVRGIALVAVASWSPVLLTALSFDMLLILACGARLRTLLRHEAIVQLGP